MSSPAARPSIVAVSHIETTEQAAAKATIIAERSINHFVRFMGAASAARTTVFDADGIADQPVNFQQAFVIGCDPPHLTAIDRVLANLLSVRHGRRN
jgi:hypothetical protein